MPTDQSFQLSCVVDTCSYRGTRRELVEHIFDTDDPAHNYAEGIVEMERLG